MAIVYTPITLLRTSTLPSKDTAETILNKKNNAGQIGMPDFKFLIIKILYWQKTRNVEH
jgi:hypothetical protein